MANASLAPVLLVSMPQMLDPNFSKTVVLLAEYGAHGAFGLVVNRRMAEPAKRSSRPTSRSTFTRRCTSSPAARSSRRARGFSPPSADLDRRGARSDRRASTCRRRRRSCARRSNPRPIRACGWWSATPAGAPGSSTSSSRESSWLLAPVQAGSDFRDAARRRCGKRRSGGSAPSPPCCTARRAFTEAG